MRLKPSDLTVVTQLAIHSYYKVYPEMQGALWARLIQMTLCSLLGSGGSPI